MAAELRAIGVGLNAGAVKPWARAAKATMRANLRILFVGKQLLKTPPLTKHRKQKCLESLLSNFFFEPQAARVRRRPPPRGIDGES